MNVSLSIKNVPEELLDRLRERARRNHRSVQGELMVILEESLYPRLLTVDEVYHRVSALGFSTQAEAIDMIREDRDARQDADAIHYRGEQLSLAAEQSPGCLPPRGSPAVLPLVRRHGGGALAGPVV